MKRKKTEEIYWWYPCSLQSYCKSAHDGYNGINIRVEIKFKKGCTSLHVPILSTCRFTTMPITDRSINIKTLIWFDYITGIFIVQKLSG